MRRRVFTLSCRCLSLARIVGAALSLLTFTGCFERQHPIDLQAPSDLPVVAANLEAPKNALPVAFVRPRDLRSDKVIDRVTQYLDFIPIGEHQMIAGADPAVWMGNGLSAGLANAGYKIDLVDNAEAAKDRFVVTSDLTELQITTATGWFSGEATCTVSATVTLFDAGKQVIRKQYTGADKASGTIKYTDFLNHALENMLNQAVPDLAGAIAAQSPQVDASHAPRASI